MAESVCRKCGKPIYKDSDPNLKNTKWVHKSSVRSGGGTRGNEIYDQDHGAAPGKR